MYTQHFLSKNRPILSKTKSQRARSRPTTGPDRRARGIYTEFDRFADTTLQSTLQTCNMPLKSVKVTVVTVTSRWWGSLGFLRFLDIAAGSGRLPGVQPAFFGAALGASDRSPSPPRTLTAVPVGPHREHAGRLPTCRAVFGQMGLTTTPEGPWPDRPDRPDTA